MFVPNRMRMTVRVNHTIHAKMPVLELYFDETDAPNDFDRISVAIVPESLDGLIWQLQMVKQFLVQHPYGIDDAGQVEFGSLMNRLMSDPEDPT